MTPIFRLSSPKFFIGALLLLPIYAYVYFSAGFDDRIATVLGGLVLLGISYAVWGTGVVIEVYKDKVIEKRLFGMAGSRTFWLSQLTEINPKPRYSSKLPKLALTFENGAICIYEFQSGFHDAREYFGNNFHTYWVA